jgi:arabinofuranosyltransferase
VKKWIVVLGVFACLYYFNAYICDDAFITFRSADNFVRGAGLRWNVAERVQVFTSPLFTLVFSAAYAIVHDPSASPNPDRAYWLALCLSFAVSAWAMVHLVRSHGARPGVWVLFAVLMSSQAFVTFTSSGLETPLSYLIVVLFFARWLRRDPVNAREYAFSFLLAGLAMLTRLDLVLLFLPAVGHLVVSGWKRLGRRVARPLLVGFSPVVAWHLFSLCYYGFLLPNSYYAKVGVDAPRSLLWWMGQYYLTRNLHRDPVTLLVCAMAVALCWASWRAGLAGLGVVLYVSYVASIGGDFLGFRFLAPPFLLSAMILIHCLEARDALTTHLARGWWRALTAAAVLYSLVMPASPLRAMYGGPRQPDVDYYYPASGLARWTPATRFPFARFLQVTDAAECQRLRATVSLVAVWGDGLNGFCRGPNAYLIDPHGITDPLMARVSLPVTGRFKPAHITKPVPVGYVESVSEGANRIADPDLAAFYGRLRAITSGPLWTLARWRSIWQMNVTPGARFRRPYLALDTIPEWMRENAAVRK